MNRAPCRLAAVLVTALVGFGCASDDPTSTVATPQTLDSAPLSIPTSPNGSVLLSDEEILKLRPEPQTLPGESVDAAQMRVRQECLAEYGVTLGEPDEFGGQAYERPAGSDLDMIEVTMDCAQRIKDLGLAGDWPMTRAELLEAYDLQITWLQCFEGLGYSIPEPISLDEFIEFGGTADTNSEASELLAALPPDEFDDVIRACG